MRTAYLDAFSGISGDMVVGSLLDAGASLTVLKRELKKLDMGGNSVSTEKAKLNGIYATRFKVKVAEKQKNRDYSAIKRMLEKSKLDAQVKETALAVFRAIGVAEAKVHNQPLETVHFHEVGAVDSIVDIVGAAICFKNLGVTRFECSPVPTGRGFANTQHGIMPIPAPATILLLKGVPISPDDTQMELTTPTGAAIASVLSSKFGSLPAMRPVAVGYGLGTKIRQDGVPNLFRVIIGETDGAAKKLMVVETNLDDATPEVVSFAASRALDAGALDAWVAPITMKKGRQAFCLSLLCDPLNAAKLRNLLLEETPTLGVRQYEVQRFELERKTVRVKTKWGEVRVKIAVTPSGKNRMKPEYEDVRLIAEKSGKPFSVIYASALSAVL
ncbi:MAG: nickel pincer cofactor biosynthesis protein LarC [Nitrospinae bacterium]|nr:nickel pincer cofactor biosynthesis protein LarC [Nitrospinota bacterium]